MRRRKDFQLRPDTIGTEAAPQWHRFASHGPSLLAVIAEPKAISTEASDFSTLTTTALAIFDL